MRKRIQKFFVQFTVFVLVILAVSQIALSSDVTPLQDIGDISRNDIEFEALRSVVERYGINVALPDRTFRGKQVLTRGDFVIYLNDTLMLIKSLLLASTADQPDLINLNNDLELVSTQLDTSNQAIATRIERIKTRLFNLESKAINSKALEDGQDYTKNQIIPEVNPIKYKYQYISQLSTLLRAEVKDITPNDPYYEALGSVLENHEINVLLPDSTFKGKEPLTRGDFAIYLSDALARLEELKEAADPIRTSQERLSQIQNKLSVNRRSKQKELESIKKRLNVLENKIIGFN
ncbi:hypothetical protein [Coleofasciculus sp. FACHB-1120]|uniref:hypothetical protein n=1 Tax=Coleofasciculus sp. FACHB-1120 TaxID=2692783 RepID=UPI001681FEFF|nr:hypothetical protein [Coleofasciculus sp. FACHB-1120]MBD2740406.1 hypothetical protein [Coleofasciculus sp. FACHB-1120]